MKSVLSSFEICAGAGGQASGLEEAGFGHTGLVEVDSDCCKTLRLNRPKWQVFEQDVQQFDGRAFRGVDLFAGGLPCPPFSVAGKQLGADDERNMFPAALRLISEMRPKAILIENVRGFLDAVFEDYRGFIKAKLAKLGYRADWRLLNASDFGVPQLRPRVIIVAVRNDLSDAFEWPTAHRVNPPTVGEALFDLMAANEWRGAKAWKRRADEIAPTLVGGSKKHGGPDLGPTRARAAWASLGVDGRSLADEAPDRDFVGMPQLTVRMTARIQGFEDEWEFNGRKTAAYRQIGNAFPPPVAKAVAKKLRAAIEKRSSVQVRAVS